MNIADVFKGERKSQNEYLIRCPYCGDHKTHNHCFVNPVKDRFMCHYCGENGTVKTLVRDHGDGVEIERSAGTFEKKKFKEVEWDQFKPVTGMSSTMDRMALKYLGERGIRKDQILHYDIRFSDYGRYYGRVLVPIFETGTDGWEVVSFMARSFIDKVKPKYLYPHHGETKLTTSECVFAWAWQLEEGTRHPVIVEGGFDAMAVSALVDFEGLSILSKQMSQAQLNKLLRLADRTFYVLLDGDARKDAIKIAKKIESYGRHVYVAELTGDDDPASVDKDVLSNVLVTAKRYTWDMGIHFK